MDATTREKPAVDAIVRLLVEGCFSLGIDRDLLAAPQDPRWENYLSNPIEWKNYLNDRIEQLHENYKRHFSPSLTDRSGLSDLEMALLGACHNALACPEYYGFVRQTLAVIRENDRIYRDVLEAAAPQTQFGCRRQRVLNALKEETDLARSAPNSRPMSIRTAFAILKLDPGAVIRAAKKSERNPRGRNHVQDLITRGWCPENPPHDTKGKRELTEAYDLASMKHRAIVRVAKVLKGQKRAARCKQFKVGAALILGRDNVEGMIEQTAKIARTSTLGFAHAAAHVGARDETENTVALLHQIYLLGRKAWKGARPNFHRTLH